MHANQCRVPYWLLHTNATVLFWTCFLILVMCRLSAHSTKFIKRCFRQTRVYAHSILLFWNVARDIVHFTSYCTKLVEASASNPCCRVTTVLDYLHIHHPLHPFFCERVLIHLPFWAPWFSGLVLQLFCLVADFSFVNVAIWSYARSFYMIHLDCL